MTILLELIYRDTCHHCHQARGYIQELMGSGKPGKIKLKEVSIDTEAGLKLAQKHDLYQLPGILVNGKLAIEGATTKQEIKEALEAVK